MIIIYYKFFANLRKRHASTLVSCIIYIGIGSIFLNARENIFEKGDLAKKTESSILLKDEDSNVWGNDYNKACVSYKKKKYEEVLKILDDIIPHMMLDSKIVDVKIMQAYSNFHIDNLDAAIYQLEELVTICKRTVHLENVEYTLSLAYEKKIHGMNRKNVEYRDEAEVKLKMYLQKYPDSIHFQEVKEKLKGIYISKFEEDLDIITTYYLLEYYDAARSLMKKIIDKIDIEEYKIKADYLTLNILYKRALLKKELPKIAEALAFCLNFISDYAITKYETVNLSLSTRTFNKSNGAKTEKGSTPPKYIKSARKMYNKLNYLIK